MSSINIIMAGFGRYRKRRKNLTAVLVMVFFLVFFFLTFFNRLDENLKTYWNNMLLGGDYVVSSDEEYVDVMIPVDTDHYFSDEVFLEENPRFIDYSTSRLRIGVLAESAEIQSNFDHTFILAGIDTEREKNLIGNIDVKNGGHYFSGDPNEIILPQDIANNICVQVGDRIIIAAQTIDGFLDMDWANVVGIQDVSSTAFIFGAYVAYAPLELIQGLIGTDLVSEIVVSPSFSRAAPATVKGNWKYVPSLESFSASRAVAIAYILLQWIIILFIGVFAFGIIYQNIMMMNEERRSEIAIYLTYGASPFWVFRMFFSELIIYTLYCSVIGAFAGSIFLVVLTMLGLYPVDSVTEIMLGGMQLVLYPRFSEFLGAFLILLALVLASALLPVLRAVSNKVIIKMFKR